MKYLSVPLRVIKVFSQKSSFIEPKYLGLELPEPFDTIDNKSLVYILSRYTNYRLKVVTYEFLDKAEGTFHYDEIGNALSSIKLYLKKATFEDIEEKVFCGNIHLPSMFTIKGLEKKYYFKFFHIESIDDRVTLDSDYLMKEFEKLGIYIRKCRCNAPYPNSYYMDDDFTIVAKKKKDSEEIYYSVYKVVYNTVITNEELVEVEY